MVMLVAGKVDVGWGQGCSTCPNLITNPILALNPAATPYEDFWFTFCYNDVLDWSSSHGSAHHINYSSGSCSTPQNESEINKICMVSDYNVGGMYPGDYTEGIFTNVAFKNSEYLEYCISVNVEMLKCASTSAGWPVTINLSLANSLVQNSTTTPTPVPTVPNLSFLTKTLSDEEPDKMIAKIKGVDAGMYSQLWIKTMPITDGVNIERYGDT